MQEMPKKNKVSLGILIIILLSFLLLAVLIEAIMSAVVLKNDLIESSELFLNQIENVVNNNIEEEQQQLDDLKNTYMTAAKTATYIVSKRESLINNVYELRSVARLLDVDELHVFDESGTIIGGTNPEYYGLNFDSGEQISFFKPMLEDKHLSMCQDVTPNTANGKNMMYAITWDSTGSFMIQVGVEPTRLLEMLQDHDIKNVLSDIPITEGYDLYAVDSKTNTIAASTNKNIIGRSATDEMGSFIREMELNSISLKRYGTKWYFSNFRVIDDYIIGITYDIKYSANNLLLPLVIIFAYLFIAFTVIALVVLKSRSLENKKNDAILKQYQVLSSMADIYYSMHILNLSEDTVEEYKSQGDVKKLVNKSYDAAKTMRKVMQKVTTQEYLDQVLEFTELTTLAERMGQRKIITMEFVGKNVGWTRGAFIAVERDDSGLVSKVIWATRSIDETKKKVEKLIVTSTTDELTGCFNRRSYEDAIKEMEEQGIASDFVYLSIDVNGLKVVNDTLGHEAGDELIIGAGKCLTDALSRYGKVYRTGGDEFVAFIWKGNKTVKEILNNLDFSIKKWRGNIITEISISYGYVTREDNPKMSLHDMAVLADQNMYEAKSMHYRSKGVDRRGQQDAHKALCDSCTKILKVNLTKDSYEIVNMDVSEQTAKKGFSNKLSEWLSGFGESGQVHPEDLENYSKAANVDYMKQYFDSGKTSLHVFYRRRYEEGYKKVMMEIIPASDYAENNQHVFLYVKDIDE